MFILEMKEAKKDADDLIQAAEVSEEIKSQCINIIDGLTSTADLKRYPTLYDAIRGKINKLIDILNDKKDNSEQQSLFEALRDVIWKSYYSVRGWKWPPKEY
ncbi:MAG: hypothetical protein Q8O87_00310 [bacterium]|nr:hypothetical protein [bacterium]